MTRAIHVLAVSLLFLSPAVFADYDKGYAAWTRGDYDEAHTQFRAAAEQGIAVAQYSLGLMYHSGRGVRKNGTEAVRWYRKAAQQGYARAQYNLGLMYHNGEGVMRNDAQAVRWYRAAAEQGIAVAQFNLGLMYAKGEGVSNNYVRAYYWLSLATAQGDENARHNLTVVEGVMKPGQIAEAQRLATSSRSRVSATELAKSLRPTAQSMGFGGISIWEILVAIFIGAIIYILYYTRKRRTPNSATTHHSESNSKSSTTKAKQKTLDQLYEQVADEIRGNKLKKALWAKAFAEADGERPRAQARYIRYRIAELQKLNTQQPVNTELLYDGASDTSRDLEGTLSGSSQVRPWVRYWARMFDLTLFSLPAGYLIGRLLPSAFVDPRSDLALGMVVLFCWVFVEAGLLSSFGTTPGKALLRTTIVSRETSISYSDGFQRSLKVWWRGFGTGFPLVSLVTLLIAYKSLSQNGRTSWDTEGGFVIYHEKIGVVRVLLAIAFFVSMLLLVLPVTTINV